MATDNNLAIDEAQRISQHEAIKSEVREQVHAEIARDAPPPDRRTGDVAASLKRKAVRDVRLTDDELDRGRSVARVSQFVDFAFYLIYGVIGTKIVLEAIGAQDGAAFKEFIDTATWPLLSAFHGLMPTVTAGRFQLVLSAIVGLAVYVMLHLAITGSFRLFARRKVAI